MRARRRSTSGAPRSWRQGGPTPSTTLGNRCTSWATIVGALAALERAAALDPGNPKPFQLMGRVLDRLGRPEEAREKYRRAREAAPR